jgi:hypothetical protein
MYLLIVGMGILFTFFSALVLSYISIATMVGPWIAPTLVLFAQSIFSLIGHWYHNDSTAKEQAITAMQAIGAGGGIIATGIGFSLPMLYFLDAPTFNAWVGNGWYFCATITVICLVAGGLGLIIGQWLSKPLIDNQQLSFPVSRLTYQAITAGYHPVQSKNLMAGVGVTMLVCWLRDGLGRFGGLIAKSYYLLPSLLGHTFAIAIWPSLWAIGINIGFAMTTPLLIGMACKYVVVHPLATHTAYLPFQLFKPVSIESFTIAFCSGIMVCELLFGLCKVYKPLGNLLKKLPELVRLTLQTALTMLRSSVHKNDDRMQSIRAIAERIGIAVGLILLLSHFSYSLPAQIGLISLTLLFTHVICQTGAEIGLIPFGRFSYIIVVPLLLIFSLTPLQATIACVFFNVCAAAASDLLFDYKTGSFCAIDRKTMYHYQWVGLIATSLCVGLILWLLFTNLRLGSAEFFAQRGQTKALLLQSLHFDPRILALGFLFGLIIRHFKLNMTMVFGGLIMPNSVSIGLALGSLSTLFIKKSTHLQSICAGILVAESLWIIISIISSML